MKGMPTGTRTLGTLLRHLLDLLDPDVDAAYRSSGLDYRARFTPVLKALRSRGSSSIRQIAVDAGITHSAASQTVAEMARRGLVELQAGADARERIVSLTDAARTMLPLLEVHWAATNRAAQSLEEELGVPLARVIEDAIQALEARPYLERIQQHLIEQAAKRPAAEPKPRGGGRAK
jgi:DNA-binding MarR family transcriptional regulator